MFKILKTTENNLTVIPGVVEGAWVHVVNPTPEEFEKTYGLGIPQKFITAPLDLNEKPHIEQQAGSTLILLRMPYYRAGVDAHYATIPLGIILCNGFVITVTRCHNPLLEMEEKKNRPFSTDRRNRFIVQIITAVVNDCVSAVQLLGRKIEEGRTIQPGVDGENTAADFKIFLDDLGQLLKAMSGNQQVFDEMRRMKFFQIHSEESVDFSDLLSMNQHFLETGLRLTREG
jgi:magnesium transporter